MDELFNLVATVNMYQFILSQEMQQSRNEIALALLLASSSLLWSLPKPADGRGEYPALSFLKIHLC